MITIIDAIHSLRPGSEWMIGDNDYSKITWLDPNTTIPSLDEIDAEIIRLQAEYDAKEYQRLRKPEYPSIGDQLDALFHAGVFPPEMAAQIQAVKDKYPKGL